MKLVKLQFDNHFYCKGDGRQASHLIESVVSRLAGIPWSSFTIIISETDKVPHGARHRHLDLVESSEGWWLSSCFIHWLERYCVMPQLRPDPEKSARIIKIQMTFFMSNHDLTEKTTESWRVEINTQRISVSCLFC